jgi:hypothetical protein
MKKCLILTLAALVVASAAYGTLGSVVRSFAIPGGSQAGLARANAVLFSVYYSGARIYRMNYTTGSVTGSFAAAGGTNTRGLCYQFGGYLWQNQAYNSPYRIYRTNSSSGSVYNYYSVAGGHYSHGSAPLATGDGGEGTTRILTSNYYNKTIYYMTTTGSIARSHSTSQALYDIAYDWRNRLIWGGMNTTTVYGYNTNGSLRASFNKPTGNVYGITYHGQYLWVAGTSGMIYQIHCPGNVSIEPTSMGKIKSMFE